jgi:hypothetical protein
MSARASQTKKVVRLIYGTFSFTHLLKHSTRVPLITTRFPAAEFPDKGGAVQISRLSGKGVWEG